MVTPAAVKQRNQRALRRYDRLRLRVGQVISTLAVIRLIAFLGAGMCGGAAILDNQWLPYGPISVVCLIVFALVVSEN